MKPEISIGLNLINDYIKQAEKNHASACEAGNIEDELKYLTDLEFNISALALLAGATEEHVKAGITDTQNTLALLKGKVL